MCGRHMASSEPDDGHLKMALRGGMGNLKPTLQSASARYVNSSVVSSKPRSQCIVVSIALRQKASVVQAGKGR